MALKMDHTGAGDITLDSTQAGELRVDGVPLGFSDVANLGDLTDVDLTGASDNDLLVRSGGNWVDTAGNLTWSGTVLTVSGEQINIADAPAFTGRADATAGSRRLLEFENWDGVSAYASNWRMIMNTGTGNAGRAQIETHTGSAWQALILFDADGTGGQRLIFNDGFLVQNDPALFIAGTQAAPGIAFNVDTDTGFYRGGLDDIGVSCGNQTYMRWNASASGNIWAQAKLIAITGNAIRWQDSTEADSVEMVHDGTDFNIATVGTTQIEVSGTNLTLTKTGAQGDAVLTIEADSNNATETSNPAIRLYQDGQLIGMNMGMSGVADTDALGGTFTGGNNNSFILNFDTTTSSTDHIQMGRGAVALGLDNLNNVYTPNEMQVGTNAGTGGINLILDEDRGLYIEPGTTTGGWARGVVARKRSDLSDMGGFGWLGSNEALTSFHIGFDASWWTNDSFSVVSGQVQNAGGSAASPGISFLGDTTTGFYRGAANEFSVSVVGVERATFTNAGTIFDTDTAAEPVYISRLGGTSEALALSVNDSVAFIDHIQDEVDATVHETRLRTTTSSSGAHRVTIYENTTESHRFYTGGEGYYMFGGGQIRVYDSTNADFLGFSHDGTDANISCGGTTDMNFTSATYYKFDNNMVNTQTATTRGISMDTLGTDNAGIKRITWNDGAGNWNFNANVRYSAGQIFASAGAGGQLRFDSDSAPCVAYLRVSNNTTNATQDSAVTWGPGITITGGATGQIDFDGTAYFANTIYPQGQTVGQITAVSGSFGSIEVTGADGTSGTWSGYSIGGEVVFMSNLTGVGTTNRAGLYDDINNAWIIQFNESQANREIEFCYAGTATLRTTVRGIDVNDTSGSDPTIGFFNNSAWGTEQAFIQSQDTGNFIIRNLVNSGIVYIQAYDSGGTSTNCVISDPDADVSLYYDGIETFRTANEDGNNIGTGAEIRHADQSFYPVGMNVSQAKANPGSFSAAATWLDYMGHSVLKTNTTAFTATTPASTDTVIPNGGIWNFLNFGGTGNITITPGSGVTLTWMDGTGGSTGSRTIADGGVATLWKRNVTNWYIWGNGIS